MTSNFLLPLFEPSSAGKWLLPLHVEGIETPAASRIVGRNIDGGDHDVGRRAGLNVAGPGEDQRDVHELVVRGRALVPEVVVAGHDALIRRVDDQGVVIQAEQLELLEDVPDVAVEFARVLVIGREGALGEVRVEQLPIQLLEAFRLEHVLGGGLVDPRHVDVVTHRHVLSCVRRPDLELESGTLGFPRSVRLVETHEEEPGVVRADLVVQERLCFLDRRGHRFLDRFRNRLGTS